MRWLLTLVKIAPFVLSISVPPSARAALKRYWKEALIVVLLIILGFGGWYMTSQNDELKQDLKMTELQLEQERINYGKVTDALADLNSQIVALGKKRQELEEEVNQANDKIKELERKDTDIVKDSYTTTVPDSCEQKIDWLFKRTKGNG